MRNSCLLGVALLFAGALTAQGTLRVVDAAGGTGKYKTIMAAVNASKSGDRIRIEKGTYKESVTIDGKALAIFGATGWPADVIVTSLNEVWTIKNHPKGNVSRLSGVEMHTGHAYGGPNSVQVLGGDGRIVFDHVFTSTQWLLSGFKGSLFANECAATAGKLAPFQLKIENVGHASFSGCRFDLHDMSSRDLLGNPAVIVTNSTVEFTRTSMRGPRDARGIGPHYYAPGAALFASNSRIRMSGTGAETVRGGYGSWSPCAVAIQLSVSRLDWSGVPLTGSCAGIAGTGAVKVQPAIAMIRPLDPMVRGRRSRVEVSGPPRGFAFAALSLELTRQYTALGVLVVDPARSATQVLALDTAGSARYTLDLRSVPVSFVGRHFAMQCLAADRSGATTLSTPFVGVLRR